MLQVLVIVGHPRRDSLSGALAESYISGAIESGADVETLYIADLSFNLHVEHPTPHMQPLEEDVARSQQLIAWADHIVFVYPTWWGTMPALLKGFIDRVFTSGFAFMEIEGGTGYAPLLSGRTAQLITTMDTPPFVYRFIYGAPGNRALGSATLGFCGITVGSILNFGPVRDSTAEKRKAWLEKTYNKGLQLRRGPLSRGREVRMRIGVWLKALRLQFYPMTFIAYCAGAFGALYNGGALDTQAFWLGYAWLFLLEVATVFSNEFFDYRSDDRNLLFGPFNGGSRVLVNRELSVAAMRNAILLTFGMAIIALGLLFLSIQNLFAIGGWFCLAVCVVAMGYTVPPLKLSYRGLGEITVGFTHSFAVIACGYFFQGGRPADDFPWLMSLPLFFSVLPSIILAGVPDYDADRAAGKKTLAVRLGPRRVTGLAIAFTAIAALTVILFQWMYVLPGVFNNILYFIIPHAALLIYALMKYMKNYEGPKRIDSLIIIALTYLVWFAVIPLINLL